MESSDPCGVYLCRGSGSESLGSKQPKKRGSRTAVWRDDEVCIAYFQVVWRIKNNNCCFRGGGSFHGGLSLSDFLVVEFSGCKGVFKTKKPILLQEFDDFHLASRLRWTCDRQCRCPYSYARMLFKWETLPRPARSDILFVIHTCSHREANPFSPFSQPPISQFWASLFIPS